MALVISLIALGVSLVSLFWTIGWSIWQHSHLTQPDLTIRAGFAVAGLPGRDVEDFFAISVTNTSPTPTTISSIAASVAGGTNWIALVRWAYQNRTMPAKLGTNERWDGFFEPRELHQALSESGVQGPPWHVTVTATDVAGRTFSSSPVEVSRNV